MPPERPLKFLALACDYDGTLARDGVVAQVWIDALERLLASGRKLLLVTGRELGDLRSTFSRLDLFHRVVAENGAVLFRPDTGEEIDLAQGPGDEFVQLLRQRGVGPISVGRVIVATWTPHETVVLETIRDLGLELQVIFNKGAVMILPSGVNKKTGLDAALLEMGLSPHNTVGIGDAENDHAFLGACECAVAVANALPSLRENADLVVAGDHGEGVRELIDRMLKNDLADLEDRLQRHWIPIGTSDAGETFALRPQGGSVLVAGTSGSGKSSLTSGYVERMVERGYQVCLFDPEGDYEVFEGGVVLGDSHRPPSEQEVLQILRDPQKNVAVNLIGLPMNDRPVFFGRLLPRLLEMRTRLGRPHVLVVDEAHHLLPATWDPALLPTPPQLGGLFLITVHPDHLASPVIRDLDVAIALGEAPESTLAPLVSAHGDGPSISFQGRLASGEALVRDLRENRSPFRIRIEPGRVERRRHVRKYAEGELPPERSFFFRGPHSKLNLRAHNLTLFLQIGEGVDDGTWMHHLKAGDYSAWMRKMIKDETLAEAVERIEKEAGTDPAESRALIRKAVEERYTAPA